MRKWKGGASREFVLKVMHPVGSGFKAFALIHHVHSSMVRLGVSLHSSCEAICALAGNLCHDIENVIGLSKVI
jgi:hypothetical protein